MTMLVGCTVGGHAAVTDAAAGPAASGGLSAVGSGASAPHRGIWQVDLKAAEQLPVPLLDAAVNLVFTRPDKTEARTEAFFRGAGTWAGRAYCDQPGRWTWRVIADQPSLNGRSGAFAVRPSGLPGKLRRHPRDGHQFAFDSGEWFLHIGDTGYRYLADTEPLWQQYVDEAAEAGFTKIRAWFCRSRGGVEALFTDDRSALNMAYWDEMERRLLYALGRYPRLQFQLIPFGEDSAELARYGRGDRMSRIMVRYAQARFSAFPNVQWCISNDRELSPNPGGNRVSPDTIQQIGRDMRAREPWGTLLTNHQNRFSGYAFTDAEWSDIVTLEDLDQVAGELILKYRAQGNDPVVNDEDRYGLYRSPAHDRYFFRRLMWASMLSGGHATYGGLETYEAFAGADKTKGVQGYLSAVRDKRLDDGAHDFKWIHQFFRETRLTMVGFVPADELAGSRPMNFKVARSERKILVYAQNPDTLQPKKANVAESAAKIVLHLPGGVWGGRWFNPRDGRWHEPAMGNPLNGGTGSEFVAPFEGDAVLLLALE